MKVRSKQSLIGPLVFYCALFLINGSAQASQTELAKGQIVDRVLCASDAAQSYALYLPSTYSADKRWPILYALPTLSTRSEFLPDVMTGHLRRWQWRQLNFLS
jgi:hypothetical protein